MRNPERYEGTLYYSRGEVAQVLSAEREAYQLVVKVSKGVSLEVWGWDDPVLLLYSLDRGPRLLEGDIIEFAGIVKGIYETKTVLGASIQVPEVSVIKARLAGQ